MLDLARLYCRTKYHLTLATAEQVQGGFSCGRPARLNSRDNRQYGYEHHNRRNGCDDRSMRLRSLNG